MFMKTLLICAQALLIQNIAAQWVGACWDAAPCGAAWGATPYGAAPIAEWAYAPVSSLAASNGPGLAVTTVSPLIPAGVTVLSDNAYEGVLVVGGAMPFLGTVALEGALPTAGAGAIAYGCGNGAVAITAEDAGAYAGLAGPIGYGAGLTGSLAYGPALASPLAYGPGIAEYGGCGYGAIY